MSASIVSGGPQRAQDAPDRPLSDLLAQGWEVQHYSATVGDNAVLEHCFYLRRQQENRVMRIRGKFVGRGLHAEWIDV